jgi:hypothetical protein
LTCCVSLSFSRSPCFRLCTPFGSFGSRSGGSGRRRSRKECRDGSTGFERKKGLRSKSSRSRHVDLHEGRLGEAQRRRRRQNWSSRWWPMLCHSSPLHRQCLRLAERSVSLHNCSNPLRLCHHQPRRRRLAKCRSGFEQLCSDTERSARRKHCRWRYSSSLPEQGSVASSIRTVHSGALAKSDKA